MPKVFPRQTNGLDCGVFICCTALHIVHSRDPAYKESEIPPFRRHMLWRILGSNMATTWEVTADSDP